VAEIYLNGIPASIIEAEFPTVPIMMLMGHGSILTFVHFSWSGDSLSAVAGSEG